MKDSEKLELNDVQRPVDAEFDAENVQATEKNDTEQRMRPNTVETKGKAWVPYVITAAVLAVLVVLVSWMRGVFSAIDPQDLALVNETEIQYRIRQLCDAFSIPGILSICFGLLVIASNGGAFDMLAYGLKTVFRLFKKDPLDRKYGSYYDYQQARKEKKRSFWYFIIVGGAYLIVGVVLMVVYVQM